MFTQRRLLDERLSQPVRRFRREDKRQPAVNRMVQLDETAIFGRRNLRPPWRVQDGGYGARRPCIEYTVIRYSSPPS